MALLPIEAARLEGSDDPQDPTIPHNNSSGTINVGVVHANVEQKY
jgi:hypothetical protein